MRRLSMTKLRHASLTFANLILAAITAANSASVFGGAVTLPFFEGFNADTADSSVAYPEFSSTIFRTVDSTGQLTMGRDLPRGITVTPTPTPTGEIVIKADIGWNGPDPGFGNAGMLLGQNNVAFHPGYVPV